MTKLASPNIIFALEAHLPTDHSSRCDFFRCKGSRNIISYITRKGAAEKDDISIQKMYEAELELSQSAPKKTILDYAGERPGSSGLFGKDKELSETELKQLKKRLSETNSIIWSSVISFTPELAANFCYNKTMAQELINENFEVLFKNSHLDFTNIDWVAAFHTNKVNPHIHLLFWEKERKSINRAGILGYNTDHMIPESNLSNFKFAINRTFSASKLDYLQMRDQIRATLRTDLLNDERAYAKFYEIIFPVLKTGKTQYGRLKKDEANIVDGIVKTIIQRNPKLNMMYNDYTGKLLKTQDEYRNLYLSNHTPVPNQVHQFYDSRVDDLHSRLGNEVLKTMRTYGNTMQNLKHAISRETPTNLGNDAKRIRIKRIKTSTEYDVKKMFNQLERDTEGEIQTMINQLDKFRAELRARGEELIDEEDKIDAKHNSPYAE